jgi:hypothetical protein
MIDTDTPDDDRALAALEKIHVDCGVTLTKEEIIEFISEPIYLGPPARLSKPKRGPHSRDTQYQQSFERRKGLYQRLVRNSKSARAGGSANKSAAQPVQLEIARLAKKLVGTIQRHKLASTIYAILWANKVIKLPPDLRTVRAHLKKIIAA